MGEMGAGGAGVRARRLLLALVAVVVLVAAALVLLSGGDDDHTEAAEPTTTHERIGSSTTESPDLGPIPDTRPADAATDPARDGGLSTTGAGSFDVDELLADVEVRPESAQSEYDRSLFGSWIDADGNGCDTRAEVLRAESATPAQVDPYGCHVLTGDWLSVYDGYQTDDPTELEIDHLVALAEAWRSGADTWSHERRVAFANDLGHPGALVAVTAAMNRSKSDKDPAVWQPPNRSAWCAYATDWVTVKQRWHLAMDADELRAVRNMLAGCGQPATTTTTAAPATTAATQPVPPPPSGSCDPSYPGVCIPPAPPDLDCGDIPYRRFQVLAPDPHGFDGNHDGVGCES
jgi:hypothetical protein